MREPEVGAAGEGHEIDLDARGSAVLVGLAAKCVVPGHRSSGLSPGFGRARLHFLALGVRDKTVESR